MSNFLLSGYGFSDNGPYFLLDDISVNPTNRILKYIFNKEFTLRRLENKYCIGSFNLETMKFETCPHQASVDNKYSICLHCRDKSGFNPAFYNSSYISPKQEIYNQRPHIVYLANFGEGVTKVGIAARTPWRWLEQGARVATIIKYCNDAYEARGIEEKTRDLLGIPEAINSKIKIKLLSKFKLSTGIKEIERLRDRLVKESEFKIEENEILCFDKNYLGDHQINNEALDLTGKDILSGKFIGMVGDIVILENDDLLFIASLKPYIGYMISIEEKIIKNQRIENNQRSLF